MPKKYRKEKNENVDSIYRLHVQSNPGGSVTM
jgi:hypothetical protein